MVRPIPVSTRCNIEQEPSRDAVAVSTLVRGDVVPAQPAR